MITKEQAMTHRGTFWHLTERNRDGTPLRVRANGQCKTWKTRPAEFKLPVKYGLRECSYITHDNAYEWCVPEEFPEHAFNAKLDGWEVSNVSWQQLAAKEMES
jgi:hypothetical protein